MGSVSTGRRRQYILIFQFWTRIHKSAIFESDCGIPSEECSLKMITGLLLSCCNVKRPFGSLSLVYFSLADGVPYFVNLKNIPGVGRRVSGMTGLARHGDLYFAALQTGPYSEIAILDESLQVKNVIALPGVRDIHGLRGDGGKLYAVSTGTSQIFEIDPSGRAPPRPFWTAQANQQIHLNDIIEFRGQRLILAHRRLDKAGKENGNVFDIDRNEVVAENMLQPHTFVKSDERLFICDSKRGQIVELRESGVVPVFEMTGRFLRGMAVFDDRIVVASSCLRVFSRSRGTARRYANELTLGDETYMSWVYFLNRCDFSVKSVMPFSSLAFEVYDIHPVLVRPDPCNLVAFPEAVRAQAMANRIAELETLLEQKVTNPSEVQDGSQGSTGALPTCTRAVPDKAASFDRGPEGRFRPTRLAKFLKGQPARNKPKS